MKVPFLFSLMIIGACVYYPTYCMDRLKMPLVEPQSDDENEYLEKDPELAALHKVAKKRPSKNRQSKDYQSLTLLDDQEEKTKPSLFETLRRKLSFDKKTDDSASSSYQPPQPKLPLLPSSEKKEVALSNSSSSAPINPPQAAPISRHTHIWAEVTQNANMMRKEQKNIEKIIYIKYPDLNKKQLEAKALLEVELRIRRSFADMLLRHYSQDPITKNAQEFDKYVEKEYQLYLKNNKK